MGQLSNPIVEKQQVNEIIRIEKVNFRHDFSVKCVVRYTYDIQNLLAFKMVKTFCDENNVVFSAREYDADKYNEDRNLIKSLPAFHMYARNGVDHWAIFYPRDNPVQKIQEEIAAWRRDEERKLAKKEAWNKKVQSLISFFENFSFRSKPVLKDPPRPRPKPKVAAVPIEL